jgi:tRNA pseudouridine38-40 synthase
MPLHRYKLTVAYDGTDFHGWQEQNPPGLAPLRTVQATLRSAIQQAVGRPIELIGASRTDSGVHALGQVAAFTADCSIPIERLALAINARLDDDLEVRSAEIAPDDFDPIGHAKRKQYRYRIWNSSQRPLMHRRHVYHCWSDLDPRRMNDAAMRLVGEHDFEGFANAGHGRLTTVRTVYDCRIEPDSAGCEVHVVIQGNGFLYNMVRIIAGTLIEVGRGQFAPSHINEILTHADRAAAGPTLPPQGLCLEWIKY